MATGNAQNPMSNHGVSNGATDHHDLEKATSHMTHEEKTAALHAAKFGYGPLSHFDKEQARQALPG